MDEFLDSLSERDRGLVKAKLFYLQDYKRGVASSESPILRAWEKDCWSSESAPTDSFTVSGMAAESSCFTPLQKRVRPHHDENWN